MPTQRADQRATKRVKPPPRVYLQTVARLTRMSVEEGYGSAKTRRTLYFTLHTAHGLNSPAQFVDAENVPEFDGDVAWFEVEKVQRGDGHRWPWWRAIRPVEPPDRA